MSGFFNVGPVGPDGVSTEFGFYDFVHQLANPQRTPRSLSAVEAAFWARENYETTYGINSHDDPDRPMSISEHTPADEPNYYSDLLSERLRQYVSCDVRKYTNLSFDEFLNRPRDEVITMLETLKEISRTAPKLPDLPS